MEEKINSTEFKYRILKTYKENRLKFFSLIIVLIATFFAYFIFKNHVERKYNYISEKYIQAGLFLTLNKNNESKRLLEEIILSKNKFYSVLSLNVILEKNLEDEKIKILDYFKIIENLKLSKEQKDLILLKKSLYLIEIGESQKSERLLKFIDNNSNFKKLAQEILND